jgi:ABC-type nickel/cobalt efflux system permease component RcnA
VNRVALLLASLAATSTAFAHPIPRDGRGRTILVRPTPAALVIEYRLETGAARALEDVDEEARAEMGTSSERFASVFLDVMRQRLPANIVASLDGHELDLECATASATLTDHLRCDFRFVAPWPLEPGQRHLLRVEEKNFPGAPLGVLHLLLAPSPGVTALDVTAPGEALLALPSDRYSGADLKTLRTASATLVISHESLPGAAKPALPPDLASRPGSLLRVGKALPPISGQAGSARTGAPPADEARVEGWSLLHLLFDTKRGVAILLLLAALFGAAHALTPGHGKAMVAAYLIGERGTVAHALALGLVTTLTHTSSVLALAVLLLFVPGTDRKAVQAALGVVGGLLIAGTGLWLLMQRLAGQADHVHLPAAEAPLPGVKPSWKQLVLLGISGGLVPCWDAILLLGMAVTAQKLWLGLPLLLAFSAGLAAVLVGVGIAVVKARALVASTRSPAQGSEVSLGRWDAALESLGRVLPLLSAVAIIVIGLWMTFASAAEAG